MEYIECLMHCKSISLPFNTNLYFKDLSVWFIIIITILPLGFRNEVHCKFELFVETSILLASLAMNFEKCPI